MVFQHFMLADNFTVWENVVLGDEPGTPVVPRQPRRAARSAARTRQPLRPRASTPTSSSSDLGVGEKQRVEILKVLYRGAEILILDEPTAVLVPQEVDELFALAARADRQQARRSSSSPTSSTRCSSYADAITVIRAGQDGRRGRRPVDRHRPSSSPR